MKLLTKKINASNLFSGVIIVANLLLSIGVSAQTAPGGTDCSTLSPICTQNGLNFTANSGGVDADIVDPGNNYDCLITQPNPSWYYLEISQAGAINMSLSAGSDIDFIIYGPYANLAAAQSDCGGYGVSPNNVVDCSFDITNNETPSIPNAQVGEVYVMLITNYANVVQNITLTQTSGTGATDCTIVNPCTITNFTANIGPCNPATGTFGVSGSVSFSDQPTTGTLTVSDCNGNQQVFNAPFTSPQAYNITNITADGAPCSVQATFSAEPGCTQSISYTNPAPCQPNCFMTYISVNVDSCDPNDNTFDLTGQVQFTDAPTTGTLTISDCNGNQQVINAPFTSPVNYTIANINSDGTTNCSVTATFSADPTCTITTPLYDNPTGCMCSADAGTFSQGTAAGSSTNSPGPTSYDLCFGDQLNVTANGDMIPPDDYTGTIAAPYDPGLWLLVYDCPPTVAPPASVNTDPCLLGVASSANGAWGIVNNLGDGSTYWYVPVTMYSMVNGTYAISINGGDWCYDLGPAYEVTFLEDIVTNVVEDCQAGTATVTVSGGLPASEGTNFTASNLQPATAGLSNTTASNGGTFTITGLQDGDNYSLDISDGTNCSTTITGTFTGVEDPSFTYPQNAYCQSAANPSPTITGVTGGTFTSTPAGLSINASTGLVNLAASTAGTYTITYTTPDPICFDQATFVLTVNPLPIVDGNDVTVCAGGTVTLNGTGADTYTWNNGVTNGVAFTAPASTTVYTVTGTITATGCSSTGTATVTVNPLDNASFTTTNFCQGSASPAATITGTPGGTFIYNPNPMDGSTVNAASGSITGGVGGTTYTLEYTTSGACPATSTQTVTVYALPVVDVPDYSICTGGTVTLTATGANTYTWSPGTYLNATTGASVNSTPAANIQYTVVGTDVNGCQNSDITNVTIIPNAPINAGLDVTICTGESTTLVATGGVSYNWLAPISAAGASQTVSPAATTTYTVNGSDAAGCTGSDQVTVTVNPLPTASISGGGTLCINGAPAPTITFTGANGTAPYTFTYNINGGAAQTIVSTGNTATITAPVGTAGTFNYNLVSVSDASATICDQTQAGTATVVVNPLPTVGAGTDQTVCQGTAVTLSGSGASTYAWDNGVINNTAFIPSVGQVTYTVTGTDVNGCQNTDQVVVTVNPNPVINAGLDQVVCDGTPVTLNGSGAGAGGSYSWNNGAVDGVAFTQAVGTVTYTVIGTDANGCQGTDQMNVTVNPNPTPTINGAAEYCTGQFSTLSTAQAYSGYLWSNNMTSSSINVTAGSYTVTVTDVNGCQGTSPAFVVIENNVVTYNSSVTICQGQSTTIHGVPQTTAGVYSQTFVLPTGCDSTSNVTLNVNPLPAVNAGLDQTVCTPTQVTLTASGASTYSWTGGVVNGTPFTQAVGQVIYTVTGTDGNGCQNTDQVTVTVNALPVVDAGVDQTVCQGTAVTLSGSGASTYSWNNGVQDGVSFTPGVGQVIYTVTGTDVNGCQSTDQVTVIVNANPIIDAGLDQTVCDGVQVTLNGSGAGAGGSYSWTGGITDGVAFTPAVGQNVYTVTGTDINGCQGTDQVTVTVNALPVVDAGQDVTVCEGSQVTLNGSGATSYAWDNNGVNGVPFTPTVGTVTYTVIGTDVNGCQNSDQMTLTVNPNPVIDAGPDQTVCSGESVILNGSGAGAGTYSWTSGVQNGVSFVPPLGVNTYTVTGTDVNGCQGTDQVVVTVNALPIVNAGNDFIICEGSDAILTGSGAVSYVWDNGVTDGVAFTPAPGTVTYTVIGTDANGCENTDQVTVTVEATPQVSFVADTTQGCEPLTVTLTNTSTGNLTDCIWTISNGTTLSGCGSVTVTIPNGGLFDVTLTTSTANGCTNSATYVDYLYVEDNPNASFTVSSSEVTLLNTQVFMDNTSTGAVAYVWNFGDESSSSTEFEPSHSFPDDEPGNYVIELIAYSPLGCTDTAYRTVKVNEELIFYVPNTFTPDNDDYNQTFKPVFTAGYDPFDFTLLIFNRWGEVIWESHDASVGWDGTYGGANDVQDGTYVWKIDFKTTMSDERVMVTGHVNVIR